MCELVIFVCVCGYVYEGVKKQRGESPGQTHGRRRAQASQTETGGESSEQPPRGLL